MGYVYLIHFRPRYKQAGHYLGYADDFRARFAEHLKGNGARLTQVAVESGIALELARVWKGDRKLERRLKRHKHSPLLCPRCNPRALFRATTRMGLEHVEF
ncbi:MAG TPA: endonuclease [Anaerolineae bacterium]|nr:endonuclease [Anaerolineae bacterium]